MMEHILSLSYGKDSLACLAAIEQLGWPLDRIVHAEVWATDEIPADLPPMVEFKAKADAIIKARWGIEVEHLCAMKNGEKLTYEKLFYHVPRRKPGGKFSGDTVAGYPYQKGAWCQDRLKGNVLDAISTHTHTHAEAVAGFPFVIGSWCKKLKDGTYRLGGQSWADRGATAASRSAFLPGSLARGAKKNIVRYLGIAADEPVRIERHQKPGFKLPLVEAGWTEAMCRDWCEKNGLLSPIYTDSARGGCWFCHNQGVGQLRLLRKHYPEYWALLMKWDLDSPVTFKADGHTVHDFDRRFQLEDEGLIKPEDRFLWSMLDEELNYRWF